MPEPDPHPTPQAGQEGSTTATHNFPFQPTPRLKLGPLTLTLPRIPDWIRRGFHWLTVAGMTFVILWMILPFSELNIPILFAVTVLGVGLLITVASPRKPSHFTPHEVRVDSETISIHPPTPHVEPLRFSAILHLRQTFSHVDLYHETISGPAHFRLYLHDFHPADWQPLTALLLKRTRTHAPRARITTPLSPAKP